MPRTPTKPKTTKPKPYSPGSPRSSLDAETTPAVSKDVGKPAKAGAYVYDKRLLVTLVLKSAKPEWDEVAQLTGKTASKCSDIWRKVIQPALLEPRPWCISTGPGWTTEEKQLVLNNVIESTKPEWEDIAGNFQGRSKNQVQDIWRKVILPRLRRGETFQ